MDETEMKLLDEFITDLAEYIRYYPAPGNHRLRNDLADWIDRQVDHHHQGVQRLFEIAVGSDIPWDDVYPLGFGEGNLDIQHINSIVARGGVEPNLLDWSPWFNNFVRDEIYGLCQWQAEQRGSL